MSAEEKEDVEVSVDDETERAARANDAYCKACEESGVKVSSWEDFSSYKEFVDGRISEPQLTEQAKGEVEQFARTFGKYVAIHSDDTEDSHEEAEKKQRAKRANKIYKQVCKDAGVTLCFFNNFSAWSDYVNGKMSDEEFYERAGKEIRRLVSESS